MSKKQIVVVAITVVGLSSIVALAARSYTRKPVAATLRQLPQDDTPLRVPETIKTVSRVHSIQVIETKFTKNPLNGQFDVDIRLKNRSDKPVVAVEFNMAVKKGEKRGWVKTNVKPDGTELPLIAPGETHAFHISLDGGSGVVAVVAALFDDGSDDSISSEAGDHVRWVHAGALEQSKGGKKN